MMCIYACNLKCLDKGPTMFLLYHSEGCNICGLVLRNCCVNDLRTTSCSGMLGHRKSYNQVKRIIGISPKPI
jgi:hypothetical protein